MDVKLKPSISSRTLYLQAFQSFQRKIPRTTVRNKRGFSMSKSLHRRTSTFYVAINEFTVLMATQIYRVNSNKYVAFACSCALRLLHLQDIFETTSISKGIML
ncbi:hypothetical protein NC652_013269 [Populus alba x Populus x berolinensis]|nr:hypothetical protein NC652_013269 [Populus alba x Populus x berolinensis]